MTALTVTNETLAEYCKTMTNGSVHDTDIKKLARYVRNEGFEGVHNYFVQWAMGIALDEMERIGKEVAALEATPGTTEADLEAYMNQQQSDFDGDALVNPKIISILSELIDTVAASQADTSSSTETFDKWHTVDSQGCTVFRVLPTDSWKTVTSGRLPVTCVAYLFERFLASGGDNLLGTTEMIDTIFSDNVDTSQDILEMMITSVHDYSAGLLVNGLPGTDKQTDTIQASVSLLKHILDKGVLAVTETVKTSATNILKGRCDMNHYYENQNRVSHSLRLMCSYFVELPAGLTL